MSSFFDDMTEGAIAILAKAEVWTGAFGVDVGRDVDIEFTGVNPTTTIGDRTD
jgi:hypothetical protein